MSPRWLTRILRDAPDQSVAARVAASSAEMILEALPPLQPQMRFLDIGAGHGLCARALVERIAGLGRLVAVDVEPSLAQALPAVPRRAARVVADRPLPFADAVFDVVVANLALGPLDDEEAFSEVHRVLKPAGWLLASLVARNSWDALFDLVLEACERAGLDDVARAVEHERERLPDEAAFATACASSDLVIVGNGPTGVEERLVGFARDGDALWADPLANALVSTWCEAAGLPAAPALAALRKPLVDATATFFPAGVPLVLHTSLWTARRED